MLVIHTLVSTNDDNSICERQANNNLPQSPLWRRGDMVFVKEGPVCFVLKGEKKT